MDDGLIVLPSDPIPGVKPIIEHFRGGTQLDTGEALHCGTHILAFGVGMIHKHPIGAAMAESVPVGLEGKVALLERYLCPADGAATFGAEAIPWTTIITVALELLRLIIESKR